MERKLIDESIIRLNRETGENTQKLKDLAQMMQIVITLNSVTLILIVSHILKLA